MQLCMGYMIALYKGPLIRRCLTRSRDELYENNHHRNAYNNICIDHIDKLLKKYVKTAMTIIVFVSIANIWPLYACKYGQKITLTALKIPFVDEGTDLEYAINLVIQAFYTIFLILGNIALESTEMFFGDSITLSAKLIRMRLNKFAKILWSSSNRCTKHQINSELLILLRQNHRVNGWVIDWRDALYWRYLLAPIMYTYAISLCIYCQHNVSRCVF